MKKVFLFLIAVLLVALCGCADLSHNLNGPGYTDDTTESSDTGDSEHSNVSVNTETVKLGFIYYENPDINAYTRAHDSGRQSMMELLDIPQEQVLVIYDVTPGHETAQAVRSLIKNGCNVIFAAHEAFCGDVMTIAAEFPEVLFSAVGNVAEGENFSVYNMDSDTVRYISGVAAGTASDRIGYVAPSHSLDGDVLEWSTSAELRKINAFMLGVRSVSENAQVELKWFDPDEEYSEEDIVESLIESGCSVIVDGCYSQKVQRTADENGVYYIGYYSEYQTEDTANRLMTVSYGWTTAYTDLVNSALNGEWIPGEYSWNPTSVTELLTCVENDISDIYNDILSEDFQVFSGEIKNNKGATVVKSGEVLTKEELRKMDFLVYGIIGDIPGQNGGILPWSE